MNWVQLFFSPMGRIGCRLYGIAMAAIIATQIFSVTLPVIGFFVVPVLNYPALCLAIKRLHDWNRTGAWMIVPYAVIVGYVLVLCWYALITFGGFGTFSGGRSEDAAIGRALAGQAGYILFLMPMAVLLLIGLIPGNRGNNRFGAPFVSRAS
jgi:uncharacterized membrane protein YhaH (DUF805 family)